MLCEKAIRSIASSDKSEIHSIFKEYIQSSSTHFGADNSNEINLKCFNNVEQGYEMWKQNISTIA
jgi:hypothetical protein